MSKTKVRGGADDGAEIGSSAGSLEVAASRLAKAIKTLVPGKLKEIETHKRTDRWDRDDFIWEALLLSMATMGNSRGALLVREERYHELVRWRRLASCSPVERERVLADVLSSATVRMAKKKAGWLAKNFVRIESEGGPKRVKSLLNQCEGREAKIEFLYRFDGIGPKYARNMLMDVFHPDFRESIAVDERIKKISTVLRLTFRNYSAAEQFYLDVAHRAGLSGWELDRLLYGYTDAVIKALNQSST